MGGKINDYLKLSLSEINEKIEKNVEILNKIWEEDDGSSWESYSKRCQPYWDDNRLLNAAARRRPNQTTQREMNWYWIVLIVVVSIYIYFSFAVATTDLLSSIDDDINWVGDAILGLLWPITFILLGIMYCTFKLKNKEK